MDSKPHRALVFVQVGDILRKRVQGLDVQFKKTTGRGVEWSGVERGLGRCPEGHEEERSGG